VTCRLARHSEQSSAGAALRTALGRLPALAGTVTLPSASLFVVAALVRTVLTPVAQSALGRVGVDSIVVDVLSFVLVAGHLLYAVVKFCVLPGACFVGGYRPVALLRVSWTVTTFQRRRAVVAVSGFVALLLLGTLLDTRPADPTSPVALFVRYGETTVVLGRSDSPSRAASGSSST
jgi:hypothetical protein